MDTFTQKPTESNYHAQPQVSEWRLELNWSAIIAGGLLGLGLLALFLVFGAGLGLSTVDPYQITRHENSAGWTIATVLWVALSGLASLFIGAWLAGHLSHYGRENAIVQGAIVWSVCAVALAAFLGRVGVFPRSSETADNRPLAHGYSSLDDPEFAAFVLDRAKNWRPGAPETPINVSADVQNRANPNKVAKNNDIRRFVESNTGLTKSQTEEFMDQEKNEIAKAQADAQRRWEDKNAIELARADRERKAAATAAWTLTFVGFLGLVAAIGGAYMGWYQRDHDILRRRTSAARAA